MTTTADPIAAIDRAYAEALARHKAGTCHQSEWSCSYCEATADAPDLAADDMAATREVGWIAREARALIAEHVRPGSPRWEAYMERKRALLAFIEAEGERA